MRMSLHKSCIRFARKHLTSLNFKFQFITYLTMSKKPTDLDPMQDCKAAGYNNFKDLNPPNSLWLNPNSQWNLGLIEQHYYRHTVRLIGSTYCNVISILPYTTFNDNCANQDF